MKNILSLAILLLFISSCKNDVNYVISGKVRDFNGQPLDSVTIRLKNRTFENVYETLSDKYGNYTLKVKEGDYYCLYAIKLPEYRVNRLEYWIWNVPVYKNININPQYDRMEIYGINVFEPQVTPQETYMVYFRPMSLTKTQQFAAEQEVNKEEFETAEKTENLLNKSDKLINVSPDSISSEELVIEINGIKSEILEINKITEYARGFKMYGYIVQVLKPENQKSNDSEYDFISVTLRSKETNEIGKGEAFVKKTDKNVW
uniref:carboxypeptidase-like regulatory domain-containing protein n=1 Tax=uncultured Draconibacterium sp. TaxID=1573823 RepID=UPI00321691E9